MSPATEFQKLRLRASREKSQQHGMGLCVCGFVSALAFSLPTATILSAFLHPGPIEQQHLASPATVAATGEAVRGAGMTSADGQSIRSVSKTEPGVVSAPGVVKLATPALLAALSGWQHLPMPAQALPHAHLPPMSDTEDRIPQSASSSSSSLPSSPSSSTLRLSAPSSPAVDSQLTRVGGLRVNATLIGHNWPLLPCGFDQNCPRVPLSLLSLAGGATSKTGKKIYPFPGDLRSHRRRNEEVSRFVFDMSLAMLKRGGTGEHLLRERRHTAYASTTFDTERENSGGGRVSEGSCASQLKSSTTKQLHTTLGPIRRAKLKREQQQSSTSRGVSSVVSRESSWSRRHESDRREARERPEKEETVRWCHFQ